MKIILVLSQKGGSGKSTVARSLAVLYAKNSKTALLDLDPQGSTIKWGEQREEVVSDNKLITHFLNLGDINSDLEALHQAEFDFVVIDTPPVISDVHEVLLDKVNYAVVPIQTTREDLETLENTIDLIETKQVPHGIVINRADTQTLMYKEGKDFISHHGKILGTIKETVQMQYCSYDSLTINEWNAKNNKSALSNQTEFVKIQENINRTLKNRKGK